MIANQSSVMNNKTSLLIKYILWALKLLLILVFSFSYLCMMKLLYCGCWGCKLGVAIGIIGLLVGLWDRYHELRTLIKK